MTHATTLDPISGSEPTSGDAQAQFALAVAWSATEPDRVGELLLIPPHGRWLFGRGEARADDPEPRVQLVRHRPARAATGGKQLDPEIEPTAPIATPFLSRVQLALSAEPSGVRIENLGRRALLVGDRKVDAATIGPGEAVELHDQLVFVCVRRAAKLPELRNMPHKPGPFGVADPQGIVGESPAMWTLRDRIAFVAARDVHVLLLGESGTGKELVARAIHATSSRRGRPLVARNAATLPASLVDAELFGNVKNYPNVGMPERLGLVGEAHGGTLFLDEIGELPLALQTHLLRVLDDRGEYQRLGDATRRTSEFRLVAATNRPIGEMRADLVARLGLRLSIPGLNDRREDIGLLVRHILGQVASGDAEIRGRYFDEPSGEGAPIPRLAPALVRALVTWTYTTHVRELGALLWEALATSPGNRIELPAALGGVVDEPSALPEVTADAIRAALAKHDGVKERVWRELGLPNRYALKRLIKKFGIATGSEPDEHEPAG